MIPFRPDPYWYSALWGDADTPTTSGPIAPAPPGTDRSASARKTRSREIAGKTDLGLVALIAILGIALAGIAAVSIPLGQQTASEIAIVN